jgi:hypothetical protein
MSDHIPDSTKMINDTPRTEEAQFGTGRVSVSFARQLERELNAVNAEIEEKRKDVVWLATEKAKLEDRIHRASMAFFRDGSDGHVASQMLQILEEERRKQ